MIKEKSTKSNLKAIYGIFIFLFCSLLTRQLVLVILTFAFLDVMSQSSSNDKSEKTLLEQATELQFQNPDSATTVFLAAIDQAKIKNDSSEIVQGLISLSFHYTQNANYLPAYDGYWQALSIADQAKDSTAIAQVYEGLGWLYSIFGRLDTGVKYFRESIKVGKELIERNEKEQSFLVNSFYGLGVLHRNAFENDIARQYLDSCLMVREPNDQESKAYVNIELAFISGNKGEYQKSMQNILTHREYFVENQPAYLVIVDAFLGDIYYKNDQFVKSEEYYLKALEAGKKHKSHQDFIPDIYQKLSVLYSTVGRDKEAYQNLSRAKALDDAQFGSQSQNNQKIMAITDKYRAEKEAKLKQLEQQRIKKLEQEAEIYSLRSTLLYVTIIFLTILIFVIYRFLRTRYKAQKAIIKKENEIELRKAQEVLEFKNKELTASTLQLIQRDELLAELKEKLKEQKGKENGHEIGKLVSHIDINKSHNWDEFNARFISVNSRFYENLKERFPNLSQGDKKICALIKLNFSSKDMSRLLGISVESVHTTRYRLRKKLNLERQDNLEDFVATF